MVEARDRIVVSDSDRGPSTEQGNVREGTFGNGKRRAERHRGYAGGRPPDIDVGGKRRGKWVQGDGEGGILSEGRRANQGLRTI